LTMVRKMTIIELERTLIVMCKMNTIMYAKERMRL